ncbi:hypothetical protein SVIOM342S_05725 [Streptomyces violaceorubidus]
MRKTPCSRARATSSPASRAFSVNGFSHSTFRPASRHRPAAVRCAECGVATYTTSTSSSRASASQPPYARGIPNRSANAFADASVREATATTSASGRSTRSAVNLAAIPPVARIPQRTFCPVTAATLPHPRSGSFVVVRRASCIRRASFEFVRSSPYELRA